MRHSNPLPYTYTVNASQQPPPIYIHRECVTATPSHNTYTVNASQQPPLIY
ncbi:predicted protein, partial [Nematostella vectensis]